MVILLLLPAIFLAADAAPANTLSDDDKICLDCHRVDGIKKDLGGGELLSLHVAGDGFANSVYGMTDCAPCHANVDLKTHPQKLKIITSSRD